MRKILLSCPRFLVVAAVAAARPKFSLATELIIALVFGDEKRLKPTPTKTNTIMKYTDNSVDAKKLSVYKLQPDIIIPRVARIRGSIISESRPEIEERIAIVAG
tara:strand:+ start:176 stop:487 length:312 start_codon:yes stop_codon:yes gene_type:complete